MTQEDGFRHIAREYGESFRVHGDTPMAVMWPKGRQALRFRRLTRHVPQGRLSILDYGCGLAHMEPMIRAAFPQATYVGADITPEFVEHNRAKYARDFHLATTPRDVPGEFDYVIMSGIFAMKYSQENDAHVAIVKDILKSAFEKTRAALSFDFMHDWVDFQRPGFYHLNLGHMLDFVRHEITKWVQADASYLPYECTITAFRNSADVD
jgi:SAM-dependent methyltransferase